jgi:RNA polymerase sigma factor (TIGR02999 family)
MEADSREMTTLLTQWRQGDQEAGHRLMESAYDRLRRLAAHYLQNERSDHTLQATALVHELYIRLFAAESVDWQDRAHFFAVAAQQLRRILIDHARTAQAKKRGGKMFKVTLTEADGLGFKDEQDLLEIDDVLQNLEKLAPRAAKVVELRFFGGLTEREIAEVLGISLATLHRDWRFARAWIMSHLTT